MKIVRITDGISETYGFLKDNKIAIKTRQDSTVMLNLIKKENI